MVPVAVVGGVALGVTGYVVTTRDSTVPVAAQVGPGTVPAARTITVDAMGSVKGRPDQATLSLGVQVDRPTAQAAMADAGTRAAALITNLKAQGVKEDDITTADVSLWPRTDSDGKNVLGYTASTMVSVVVRDIARVGGTIDGAVGAAGDDLRVSGVSFSIADTTALASKARELAVQQAKAQAVTLARAAGVNVGAIVAVSTTAYDLPQPQVYAAAGATDAAAMPIQPGTQQVTAHVSVVFELT
jgi:hypothetical protein